MRQQNRESKCSWRHSPGNDWCRGLTVKHCQAQLESEVYLEKRWVWLKHLTPKALSVSATRQCAKVKCFLINIVSQLLFFRVTGETKELLATKEREWVRAAQIKVTYSKQQHVQRHVLCRHTREWTEKQEILEKTWVIPLSLFVFWILFF